MKNIIPLLLASFFMFGCSDKKNTTNTSNINSDSTNVSQQITTDSVQETYMDKEYKQLKAEHNSKLSYCKYVTIGVDTVFFTKNIVGHERLDNYIMPISFARPFAQNSYIFPFILNCGCM